MGTVATEQGNQIDKTPLRYSLTNHSVTKSSLLFPTEIVSAWSVMVSSFCQILAPKQAAPYGLRWNLETIVINPDAVVSHAEIQKSNCS